MSESDDRPATSPVEECSTTDSFSDHGIDDGTELVTRTYYRLLDADLTSFEPTERFFHQLATAFRWAYLGTVERADVPSHVEFAIEDARAHTADEFAERPDADLRTDVLPAFYQRVAGFHCVYRE